ncbi:hypothetical protein IT413_02575 [Candidatus Peregrinibacteria bacterium]|nr:hypothetical protein [Candidatus Peregrinibacteria bacterium]
MMKTFLKTRNAFLIFAQRRLVFDNKASSAESKTDAPPSLEKKTKAEALKEVKTESDKRVAVVKGKLDKIGGRFTGDLYDRLYEYYQKSLDMAAKDGTLDKKAFDAYKKQVLDKTDEILKKYTPSEADQQAAKEGNAAAKDILKLKDASPAKLDNIPKELPEDTPIEKLNDHMQEYAVLNASFQEAVQKRLGDINGFYETLQQYQDSKKGFSNRASLTWDKLTGILPGVDCNDDKKVEKLQRELRELKDEMESKRSKYKKKKEEIEKYGKSISRVMQARRGVILKKRNEEIKKLEEQKGEKADAIKANEKRYGELKAQQLKLVEHQKALSKKKDDLETLRNADDSPANVAKKLEQRKIAVGKVSEAEKEKESALAEMLKEPNLTDEQKEAINQALAQVQERKRRANVGATYLDKSAEKAKGVDVAMSEEESAVESDLGTVGDTIDKVVEPSMISTEEQILVLETQKQAYAECIEGVKDKYDYHLKNLDSIQRETDNHLLDASLANSLSFSVFDKACSQLDKVKVETEGVFGVMWNNAKYLYQDTVGQIAAIPGEWLTKFGKWIIEQGNVATQGAYDIESGWKYPAGFGANVLSLFTGASGGLFELAGGLCTVVGKPFDTLEGLGALLTINAKEGTVGDTELAGKAWKELGKALISYEEFEKGNVGSGIGKVLANVASLFVGGEAAQAAKVTSTAARAEVLAAAGSKAGIFTGRVAEASTFFRTFAAEAFKKPGFLKTSAEVSQAAEIANFSKGASAGMKGLVEAKTVAELGERSGTVVQSFEKAEQAANAAHRLKAERAAELAKRAEAAEKVAANSKLPKHIKAAEELRTLAHEYAAQASKAEEAAVLAKRAHEAAKTADDAIKSLQEIEKAKGPLSTEAVAATAKVENLLKEAQLAADAAQVAAEAVGGGGKLAAIFKYYGEKTLERLPGGTKAADRFATAEGAGAKGLAVAQGTAEVALKTAWETAKLGAKGVKFLGYDMPIGIVRYSTRLFRSIPQLTKLVLKQGVAEGSLRFARVSKALNVMEHEAENLGALRALWTEKVLGNENVVQGILKGIKEDKALAEAFKGTNFDDMAKLIKEDPSLMKLYEAHPQFHKIFEGRALIKFMEFDKQSAVSLSNIQDAAEVIFQFSAKDEQVARILDKIFEKGLYPKVAKASKAKKSPDAAKAEPATVEILPETKVEPIIDVTIKDGYARMRFEAEIHPHMIDDLMAGPEKKLVESFEAKHSADAVVDPARLARSLENEFEKIQFLPDRKIGEIKIKDTVFELKANGKGKIELYESGKADAITPAPKPVPVGGEQLDLFTPEGKPAYEPKGKAAPGAKAAEGEQLDLFTQKQLNLTAEEAAIEARAAATQDLLIDMRAGKVPTKYPSIIDDTLMSDRYFAGAQKPDVMMASLDRTINEALAAGKSEIMLDGLHAKTIESGYLSALRKRAANQGLEIGEFKITERVVGADKMYEVSAPVAKMKAAPSPVAGLSPELESILQQSQTYKFGRYLRGKIDNAKGLYKSLKSNPSEKTKLTLDKILKDNGVFVTKALGRGAFIHGTIEEQIASLEYAVVKIETLGEFPPDLTFPQEFLDWQQENEKPAEPPSDKPGNPLEVASANIESSPEDEEKIKLSADRALDKFRSKDPSGITVDALTAALNIELSTFDKKASKDVQTVRDGIKITIGAGGKKSYEGLQEWIEDLPSKKKVGQVYKAAFEHGMNPQYYVDLHKGAAFKDSAELQQLMVKDLQDQISPLVSGMNLTRELKVYSKSGNFTTVISLDKNVTVTVQDRWAEETFSRLANTAAGA